MIAGLSVKKEFGNTFTLMILLNDWLGTASINSQIFNCLNRI